MEEKMTIFLATLKDMETLLAARKYVPKENVAFEPFNDLLERYAISLKQQYKDGVSNIKELKVEAPRLIGLHASLEDVPKAKNIINTILKCEIEVRSLGKIKVRDKFTNAHPRNILLNLWDNLQSAAKIEKVAVEDAVLNALLLDSHAPVTSDRKSRSIPI